MAYTLLPLLLAISISPLLCQNITSLPPQPVRTSRSLLSSFFDGFHKLVHGKKELLNPKQQEDKKEAAEDEKEAEVVVIRDKNNLCRTEFVLVESVHYALETTEECVSQNVTNCKKEPYNHCQDVVRDVCREALGQQCRDKECETKFKEEMSNTKVRECNEECLQDPSWREDTCQCRDVTRLTKIKVPFLDCRLLKRKQCRSVPVTQCRQVTEEQCETRHNTTCTVQPEVNCRNIQRKVPHTLQRRKPVEVCQDTSAEDYVIEA